jgi:vacuolar-type H+-ATPase subunit C/Vma6
MVCLTISLIIDAKLPILEFDSILGDTDYANIIANLSEEDIQQFNQALNQTGYVYF